MNRIILIILTLLIGLQSYAIKPTRTYSNTPSKMELEHEVLRIETKDGISLNVWDLPSADPGTPIIISQSDSGNMGDWLFLGLYLHAYGLDVWMYDYRGFGESEDFENDNKDAGEIGAGQTITAVAAFGMILRDSEYKGTADFDMGYELVGKGLDNDPHGYKAEFQELITAAKSLASKQCVTLRLILCRLLCFLLYSDVLRCTYFATTVGIL